ncbi:hypothetical protein [Microbacterium rhizophilus]|uniref:hypothetical protein n=1 Tax=Microbacterium rhizophilus TaxID=3138934 RepID=UPI0031EA7968
MKKQSLQKSAAALVLAGALAVAAPAAASAATRYTPPTDAPTQTLTVTAGGTVTVALGGFQAGEPVTISLTGEFALQATIGSIVRTAVETQTASLPAAADGTVSPDITLPANATGSYTVTATGATSGNVATAVLALPAAAGGPGTGLAATGGSDMTGLWVGGGALLLTGGAVIAATTLRRRRQQA